MGWLFLAEIRFVKTKTVTVLLSLIPHLNKPEIKITHVFSCQIMLKYTYNYRIVDSFLLLSLSKRLTSTSIYLAFVRVTLIWQGHQRHSLLDGWSRKTIMMDNLSIKQSPVMTPDIHQRTNLFTFNSRYIPYD